jgi:hypothetical protein
MARGISKVVTCLIVATMSTIGHIRLRRNKTMIITVVNTLTRVMVEEAMMINNAQMTIMVESALKRVTEEAMANDSQTILMTPPAVMVHNAVMTTLLTVAVVLAARVYMEVRDPTTTAGTAARNDKMILTTTAILVVRMEDMDKLVSEHRLGDTTHPMVNLTSQAMEATT